MIGLPSVSFASLFHADAGVVPLAGRSSDPSTYFRGQSAVPTEVRFTMAEDVRAEMVSTVYQVVVSEGDVVADGDTLVILESMKMEIPVLAEVPGTVTTVGVKVGDVIHDLLAEHTDLPGAAVDHLQRVVGEWQLLADLSFADVLLWVGTESEKNRSEGTVICVAHCRPTTASTAFPEDAVGTVVSESEHPQVLRALVEGRVVRGEDETWREGMPPRREAVPVRLDGRVIAVLSRDTNLSHQRAQSPLELAYLDCAEDLCQMISDGTFPIRESRSDTNSSPRAGDGFIRLDTEGTVVYASPNALSAYHRMGLSSDLVGQDLAALTRSLVTDPFESQEAAGYIRDTLADKPGRRMEIEARGATVLLRALVLKPGGRHVGAAVVVRDVTEVKRRDRALLSKDATIREIHHRVKNNLQTVAALLRLQARRTGNDEARQALTESVRRVTSIALVHDTLSMSVDEEVDLDEVIDRLVPMLSDV
eukprot:gene23110-27707_t